jgi:hypothetical protein
MSSYIGYSNLQRAELIETDLRIDALEAALPTKVDLTVYNNKVALLEGNDATHTADIAALNANKVDKTTYNAKVAELTTTNATQDTRLSSLEALAATKVAQVDYDAKVADLESVDAAFGVRLTNLEDRATSIQNNISTNVQAAIDDKVSDAVFQALATELRDKDSELNGILATKVAQTVQDTTDAAQNAQIALRVLKTDYDTKMSSLDGKNVNWEKRLLAIDQWIRAMLATYTIKKADNNDFVYSAAYQNDVTINPAPFAITGKTTGNKLYITMQPFAYNTFYGNIKATTVAGVTIGTLTKAAFNSTTFVGQLASSVTLDSSAFPLTVTLSSSDNVGIQSTQLSLAQYQALTDPSPPPSVAISQFTDIVNGEPYPSFNITVNDISAFSSLNAGIKCFLKKSSGGIHSVRNTTDYARVLLGNLRNYQVGVPTRVYVDGDVSPGTSYYLYLEATNNEAAISNTYVI